MDRIDKEGKQMLLTVLGIYNDADNGYKTKRPGFEEPMNLLHDVVVQINVVETAAGQPIEGDTTNKANKFESMCTSIFFVESAAKSYYSATATADPDMKKKVSFSLSYLKNMPYNEAETRTQGILNVVVPIKDNLSPYGVAPEDVVTAQTKRTEFLAVQLDPQIDIDNRKVQNENIHPLVTEGKRILTEMCDSIADTLFSTDHDLYLLWYNARELVHYPHGTTIVEGFVFKNDGKTGIYNAKVEFAAQQITVFTKIDGSYLVPKFPHGVAEPTASYGDVSKKADPFNVKQGKTVVQNFVLNI